MPESGESYHFWRVSEGVPGTAMPSWKLSVNETEIWKINLYELSFASGSIRTITGDFSDAEAIDFSNRTNIVPPINGTQDQFDMGKNILYLYVPSAMVRKAREMVVASILTPRGYIVARPANFTESGVISNTTGNLVWKVREGVETTNMPPWKYSLSDDEIYRTIFYVQNFSAATDYNAKWGPLYKDNFARNMRS
jgi:cytochrome c oxidase cbb3-type subunit I/II